MNILIFFSTFLLIKHSLPYLDVDLFYRHHIIMFRLLVVCLLVFVVDHGQTLQIGEANMHFDSNSTSVGILTLLQRDANHPVRIVGTIRGLASNTVHVSGRRSIGQGEGHVPRQ